MSAMELKAGGVPYLTADLEAESKYVEEQVGNRLAVQLFQYVVDGSTEEALSKATYHGKPVLEDAEAPEASEYAWAYNIYDDKEMKPLKTFVHRKNGKTYYPSRTTILLEGAEAYEAKQKERAERSGLKRLGNWAGGGIKRAVVGDSRRPDLKFVTEAFLKYVPDDKFAEVKPPVSMATAARVVAATAAAPAPPAIPGLNEGEARVIAGFLRQAAIHEGQGLVDKLHDILQEGGALRRLHTSGRIFEGKDLDGLFYGGYYHIFGEGADADAARAALGPDEGDFGRNHFGRDKGKFLELLDKIVVDLQTERGTFATSGGARGSHEDMAAAAPLYPSLGPPPSPGTEGAVVTALPVMGTAVAAEEERPLITAEEEAFIKEVGGLAGDVGAIQAKLSEAFTDIPDFPGRVYGAYYWAFSDDGERAHHGELGHDYGKDNIGRSPHHLNKALTTVVEAVKEIRAKARA